MTLEDQQLIFKYFTDTYDAAISAAKSAGNFDAGITQIQASKIVLENQHVIHTDAQSGTATLSSKTRL